MLTCTHGTTWSAGFIVAVSVTSGGGGGGSEPLGEGFGGGGSL